MGFTRLKPSTQHTTGNINMNIISKLRWQNKENGTVTLNLKKSIILLAVIAMPVLANQKQEEAQTLANQGIVDLLVDMQIDATCLKQTDGEKTFIVKDSECLKTLNDLTEVFSQEKGFESQLKRVIDFKASYQI